MEKLPIFDHNNQLTALENSKIFDLFYTFFFYDLVFFFLEYRETHFPGLFCLKLKHKKIANLRPNHGPLEKSQIFDFLNSLFF